MWLAFSVTVTAFKKFKWRFCEESSRIVQGDTGSLIRYCRYRSEYTSPFPVVVKRRDYGG